MASHRSYALRDETARYPDHAEYGMQQLELWQS
jgi:hypothetical protein